MGYEKGLSCKRRLAGEMCERSPRYRRAKLIFDVCSSVPALTKLIAIYCSVNIITVKLKHESSKHLFHIEQKSRKNLFQWNYIQDGDCEYGHSLKEKHKLRELPG